MSAQLDEALDLQDAGPDYAPTARERALVTAFQWGHISLAKLWAKLGSRALYVCPQAGIVSSAAQLEALEGEEPGALAHVSTAELIAELDRRSAT